MLQIEGEEIGEVNEILTPGANDVWVVKGKGGKNILIPYIEEVVKEVMLKIKRIIIDAYGRVALMMKIDVLSLFPEMFTGFSVHSILKKASEKEAVTFQCH